MEAGAEEGGVGQGLELAQEFPVILPGGEALQQAGGEMDEIAFLAGRAERMQAGSVGGFPHAGELEMGGEVALAWVLQRIGPGPVARVGLEGALGAVGVAIWRRAASMACACLPPLSRESAAILLGEAEAEL